jgi:hypothetical protein
VERTDDISTLGIFWDSMAVSDCNEYPNFSTALSFGNRNPENQRNNLACLVEILPVLDHRDFITFLTGWEQSEIDNMEGVRISNSGEQTAKI